MSFCSRKEALKAGKSVLRKVSGSGWKLDVWENFGWHYSLRNGGISLYQSDDGRFWTLLSVSKKNSNGGELFWGINRQFSDPNKAVSYQLMVAQKYVEKLSSFVASLSKRLKKKDQTD